MRRTRAQDTQRVVAGSQAQRADERDGCRILPVCGARSQVQPADLCGFVRDVQPERAGSERKRVHAVRDRKSACRWQGASERASDTAPGANRASETEKRSPLHGAVVPGIAADRQAQLLQQRLPHRGVCGRELYEYGARHPREAAMNDPIRYERARAKAVRPVIVQLGRLSAAQRAEMSADDVEPSDAQRPRTRRDCLPGGSNECRPCVWVSCKHNLYIDAGVSRTSFQINMPDIEPQDMSPSACCALDIADTGGATARDIAAIWRVSHQRIFQIEVFAMRKAARLMQEVSDGTGGVSVDPRAITCGCGVRFVPRSTVHKICGKGCPSRAGSESAACRQCGAVFVKRYRTERVCSDECRAERQRDRARAYDARHQRKR